MIVFRYDSKRSMQSACTSIYCEHAYHVANNSTRIVDGKPIGLDIYKYI